ncbi:PLP-dependent aminotransferase family protein [Sphingobium aromaticiconvertens]|uniref:aminotransferase-like domain-containing protein n=1 Tax=Sphingobium aromaticiconvertens TaxID=365341 RepID=UPI003017AB90
MQRWAPDIGSFSGPKYLAIAEALARDIESGALGAGTRLPPQRALAGALGVDLTTVTRAYGEAQKLGLIEGDGRRGSFVREKPLAASKVRYRDNGDVGMNAPPEVPGGLLNIEFRRSAEALLASNDVTAPFQYQPSGGLPIAREAGATLLMNRGIPCEEDSVLIAAGGQHALHAIFSAELKAGDLLAVCAFAYPGLLALARRYGVRLLVIRSDEEGMDPEALEAACIQENLRSLYVVPTNDNPTTITMGIERRKALASVAVRHGLMVIEDDAYGMLPERSQPPIASFAPDCTWHIASVSKILTPGLRVAWLRAPDISKAWRLSADMHETAIMAAPLNAAIVVDWLDRGVFQQLVNAVRTEARHRQALARECLPPGSFMANEEGYHLWVPLTPNIDPGQIAGAVRTYGLSVIGSDAFAVERTGAAPALRVSIGGTIARERLERGLRLLAALIGSDATGKISLV